MFRTVFGTLHRVIDLATMRASRTRRDQALALLAPIGLLMLPVLWLVTLWLG